MIGLRYSMYEVVRLTHMYQSALNSPRRRARFRYPSEDIMMIPEGNIHHLNESISFGGPGHLPNPPKFHKPPGSDPKECLVPLLKIVQVRATFALVIRILTYWFLHHR